MAIKWQKNKVNENSINDGYEYERKDRPTRQQLNAIVNNSLYASDIAENIAEQISNLGTNDKIEFKGSNPNLLINGDFSVNQRGQEVYGNANNTTQQYPSGIFTVDRWRISRNYTGTFNTLTKTLSTGSMGTYCNLSQIIELDLTTIVGKQVTFSFDVQSTIRTQFAITLTRNGNLTNLVIGTNTSNLMNRVSVTATIPTDVTSSDVLGVGIYCNGGNNDSCTIGNCKLEVGSVTTPFVPRPYAEELPMCMRYYQIRTSAYTFPSNVLDCPIPMYSEYTRGTTTINGTTYNYIDAEIY